MRERKKGRKDGWNGGREGWRKVHAGPGRECPVWNIPLPWVPNIICVSDNIFSSDIGCYYLKYILNLL